MTEQNGPRFAYALVVRLVFRKISLISLRLLQERVFHWSFGKQCCLVARLSGALGGLFNTLLFLFGGDGLHAFELLAYRGSRLAHLLDRGQQFLLRHIKRTSPPLDLYSSTHIDLGAIPLSFFPCRCHNSPTSLTTQRSHLRHQRQMRTPGPMEPAAVPNVAAA